MNQRIRELEKKAEKFVLDIPASLDINEYTSVFNEKFAELILTEVISTIYRSDISDKKQEKLVDELAYKFGMNISETKE